MSVTVLNTQQGHLESANSTKVKMSTKRNPRFESGFRD